MKIKELLVALKNGKLMADTNALESQLKRINYGKLSAEGQFEVRETLKQLYEETRIDVCGE
jgi:hypothetical protein